MLKRYFYFLIMLSLLLIPGFIFADGGMIIWPPEVHLDQSAQNAIVAWDGKEEIIILSNDIESDAGGTALRIIPLPSGPTEIKEGDFESFEKVVEIMNEKLEEVRNQWLEAGKSLEEAPSAGIEITFQEKIGAHDITVVKVSDLNVFLNWIEDFAVEKGYEIKEISSEFKQGVRNYLKRDIKYFVFDVIDATERKESINPLIYHFESDYFYYPLKMTAISEIGSSYGKIQIFLIVKEFLGEEFEQEYPVEITQEELKQINEDLADLFESGAKIIKIDYYGELTRFDSDLALFPAGLWQRNLTMGNSGEDVKTLQKLLINMGVWDSDAEATGYFGPITQKALTKFQENNSYRILRPLGLEEGTGFFGPKTREFLEGISVKPEVKENISWNYNLYLGNEGEDVKRLQEILIAEGVWLRPDIEATGYFGSITKAAVIRFQEKYSEEILEPLGLTKGTGFVGPSTRSYLREIDK